MQRAWRLWFVVMVVLTGGNTLPQAWAQRDTLPSQLYYATLSDLYQGYWNQALRDFVRAAQRGQHGGGGPWLDSICYYAMIGECHYQLGNYPAALENFTAAMQIWLKYPQWLLRVQWPERIQPATQVPVIPWGKSQRQVALGRFPARFGVLLGGKQAIPGLGFISTERIVAIDVDEIVRCMLWSMRRYRQLRGPVGTKDELAKQLVATFGKRPIRPNHWSGAWMDLLIGMSLRMQGRDGEAMGFFKRSLVAGGQFDHPLSALGLLELAEMAAEEGQFAAAEELFLEASYSAYVHEDYSGLLVLPEALHGAAVAHIIARPKVPLPTLEQAAAWAGRERIYWFQALWLTDAAELALTRGETAAGRALIDGARAVLVRRGIGRGRLGARYQHVLAIAAYQEGKRAEGDQALTAALAFQRAGGSLWAFHLAQLDTAYSKGKLTPRQAERLYQYLLRDPSPLDWQWRTLETLSILNIPHEKSFENWFFVSLQRRAPERAVEVADRLRRHRFYMSLPLGGRLLNLRWLLHGPEEAIPQPMRPRRRQLLVNFPAYEPAAKRCEQMIAALREVPLAVEEKNQRAQRAQLLAQLDRQGQLLELGLRHMAVRREPGPRLFPPPVDFKAVQESLRDEQAVLFFVRVRNQIHAFLIARKKYDTWRLRSPNGLQRQIASLLQAWGNLDRHHKVKAETLASQQWKTAATTLAARIFASPSHWRIDRELKELIVIPEGPLWYLPLEALVLPGEEDKQQLLIQRYRVRYLPFLSLVVPLKRGPRPLPRTLVVLGTMVPGQPPEQVQRLAQPMEKVLPEATFAPLSQLVPAGSLAPLVDRMVVLHEVPLSKGPYLWSPIPHPDALPTNRFNYWMQLPWGVPQELLFPAFQTAAASGLRGRSAQGRGDELFLLSAALMASGAQTVLLGRWAPGGASSAELLAEYLADAAHATPPQAWRRAVLLMQETPVHVELEPRVDLDGQDAVPRVGHPFFWANILLLDRPTRLPEDREALAP